MVPSFQEGSYAQNESSHPRNDVDMDQESEDWDANANEMNEDEIQNQWRNQWRQVNMEESQNTGNSNEGGW